MTNNENFFKKYWFITLGVILTFLSIILHYFHYLIFKDAHHLLVFLVADIAFVPLEVLFVSIILHKLLDSKEKKNKKNKQNLVISTFFDKVGITLAKTLFEIDYNKESIRGNLKLTPACVDKDFKTAFTEINDHKPDIKLNDKEFTVLQAFFEIHKPVLENFLENPVLNEHDSFTDLLWAIFHICDEVIMREHGKISTDTDRDHLINDVKRAYNRLLTFWLEYMNHQRKDYPFLFSLSVRKNPFNPEAKIEF